MDTGKFFRNGHGSRENVAVERAMLFPEGGDIDAFGIQEFGQSGRAGRLYDAQLLLRAPRQPRDAVHRLCRLQDQIAGDLAVRDVGDCKMRSTESYVVV